MNVLRWAALAVMVAASATSAVTAATARPAPATFTQDQYWRGRYTFILECAECHGGDAGGKFGPALRGVNSNIPWQTPKAVYGYMVAHMPVSKAGELSNSDYLDVMAYLMEMNGRAAGTAPLRLDALNHDPHTMDGSPVPGGPGS